MSFITLDFETAYSSKKDHTGKSYSLKTMTYEEYLFDPRFKIMGVGIKIDNEPTYWIQGHDEAIEEVRQLFPEGNNHTLLCHNTLFDGAILHWILGLSAAYYFDTLSMSRAIWRYNSARLGKLAKRIWPDDPKMRKGKELASIDGVYEPSDEILADIGSYCIQDVDLTFEAFKTMLSYFPHDELDVIDMTLRLGIEPTAVLDVPLVKAYQKEIAKKRHDIIKKSGIAESTLKSADKFVAWVKENLDITIEKVASPTKKNPDNMKYPLAKNDLEFLQLQWDYPEYDHIWQARLAAASNQEKTRCVRFLNHVQANGTLAMPLNYCAAGTGRWSGANKINMQNLGRKSKLRNAITAPPGHKLVIRDLSNIEGRVLAWFADEDWKCKAYADGEDLYNKLATGIFGYKVDRKALDENGNKLFEDEGNVGKVGELGLGYGMGKPTFKKTCWTGPMGMAPIKISDELAQKTVTTFRNQNPRIALSWQWASRIIFEMARKDLQPFEHKCLRVENERIRLPNGLYLQYPELHLQENEKGESSWVFWNGKYWKYIYGGLLCLSSDTNVLTKKGNTTCWTKIIDVTTDHLLWDGTKWVTHDGLIYKGSKEVVSVNGVRMTPDHEVLTTEGWKSASQSEGLNRSHSRLPDDCRVRWKRWEKIPLESELRLRERSGKTCYRIYEVIEKTAKNLLRMLTFQDIDRATQNTRKIETPDVRDLEVNETTMHTTSTSGLCKLWRARDKGLRPLARIIRKLLGRHESILHTRVGPRPNRQQQGLHAAELSMGNQKTELQQPEKFTTSKCGGTSEKTQSKQIHDLLPAGERMEVRKPRVAYKEAVYDLVNAGDNNCFTVRDEHGKPMIVHNCENIIQALSRIIMSEMLVDCANEARRLGGSMIMTVHDEGVWILPEDKAEEFNAYTKKRFSITPEWADDKLVLTSEGGISNCYDK